MSAFAKRTVVPKSACPAGMMKPRGSRYSGLRSSFQSASPPPPPRPPRPPPRPGRRRRATAAGRRERRLNAVHLVRRERPVVFTAPLNRVGAHPVDAVQERLAEAGRQIEHRVVGRDRVVDRLPEAPGLRRDRVEVVRVGDVTADDERNRHRRGIADRLGEEPNLVVKVRRRPQAAVPPGGIAGAAPRGDARLVLGDEPGVHRRTHHVDARDDVRMNVVVVRVAEGRREHHRSLGTCLVMVVHDLRIPLAVHHAAHVGRLRERVHVRVAIVVVARVVVVEHRQAAAAVLHVVVGCEVHAVRIGEHRQHDDVTQNPRRLVVGARDELVDRLDELLGAEHLGGVQAAIDPDHGLALAGERAGLVVGEPAGARQAARDLLVAIETREVLGRRDDRHELRPVERRAPDLDHLHAVGLAIELAPVRRRLLVVGEEVVIADVVPPLLHRRGHRRRLRSRRRRRTAREWCRRGNRERDQGYEDEMGSGCSHGVIPPEKPASR